MGMNEIKNDIKKSILRLFGHVMRMGEDMIPKKMLHTHREREGDQKEDPDRQNLKERENRYGRRFLYNSRPIVLETI